MAVLTNVRNMKCTDSDFDKLKRNRKQKKNVRIWRSNIGLPLFISDTLCEAATSNKCKGIPTFLLKYP